MIRVKQKQKIKQEIALVNTEYHNKLLDVKNIYKQDLKKVESKSQKLKIKKQYANKKAEIKKWYTDAIKTINVRNIISVEQEQFDYIKAKAIYDCNKIMRFFKKKFISI